MATYRIQARSTRNYSQACIIVLYGTKWEDCEGTQGLIEGEGLEIIAGFLKDDRLTVRESMGGSGRMLPHEYRIVEEK